MVKMEESTENLRTTKELILDENKLVTYISLSKDLCIHVNEAKNFLRKVVDDIKVNNANIQLNVSYLISGLTSNNTGLVTVCPESELQGRRATFKTIHFQHIYSVCQGSSGLDTSAFVCVNKFDDILLCAGLVKGLSCTKRSSEEIGNLKSNSQKSLEIENPIVPIKKEIKEKANDVGSKSNNVVKIHETKSEPVIKSEVVSPKKESSSTNNVKSNVKNSVKPSKGIAGFFTKSNSAPSTKPKALKETESKSEAKPEVMKESKSDIQKETNTRPNDEEDMDVDVESPIKEMKKEPASAKKSSSKKNKVLNAIKKNAKVDKKRKRVLHVSDSDSDDPFAEEKEAVNNESEDEIPTTPTISTVKVTGILNPKKRRKIVDKTYTDEEGYILTRKEEVYESCSDEEMETQVDTVPVKAEKENIEENKKAKIHENANKSIDTSPKEKKAKNTKKKVSPPQKGKQPNIMSFFKKV